MRKNMTITEFANKYGLEYNEVRIALMKANGGEPKHDYWNEKNVKYPTKDIYYAVEEYILKRLHRLNKRRNVLISKLNSLKADNPFEGREGA